MDLANTEHLVEVCSEVVLEDNEILVNYGEKSLFISIPVEESICICKQHLEADQSLLKCADLSVETTMQLLRFCLTPQPSNMKTNIIKN